MSYKFYRTKIVVLSFVIVVVSYLNFCYQRIIFFSLQRENNNKPKFVNMKRRIYLLLISFLIVQMGFAQHTIKGTVVDQVNQPIIGATVMVDGTSHGAVTDINGQFTVKDVLSGSTVSFSFVGMKTKKVKASSNMQVTMEDDAQNLEDIVVIGYGAAKAKDLTSPIAVIKST